MRTTIGQLQDGAKFTIGNSPVIYTRISEVMPNVAGVTIEDDGFLEMDFDTEVEPIVELERGEVISTPSAKKAYKVTFERIIEFGHDEEAKLWAQMINSSAASDSAYRVREIETAEFAKPHVTIFYKAL